MFDQLKELGVEVDRVLVTLNGKQALYEKLIFKFYDMLKDSNLTEEIGDDIYERVHALKGAAGNLGITPLFNEYVKILGLIKESRMDEVPDAIKAMFPIQEQIMNCIEEYRN